MAEIINLRRARKARERADRTREAQANRAKFGRSKAEKQANRHEQARLERGLDGARRERGE